MRERYTTKVYQDGNENKFCAITVLLEVPELIEPDSALLQCRPLPSV